jgi:hypothetical protein
LQIEHDNWRAQGAEAEKTNEMKVTRALALPNDQHKRTHR